MQFASPKGLLNFLTGGNSSILATNEGKRKYSTHTGFASLLNITSNFSQLVITEETSRHFDFSCANNKTMGGCT